MGDPARPYSFHPYAYALSNPVLLTDPSGRAASTGGDGGGCTPARFDLDDPRAFIPGDCQVRPPSPQPKQRLVPTQAQPPRLNPPAAPKPADPPTVEYTYDNCDQPSYQRVRGSPPPRDTGLIQGNVTYQWSLTIATAFEGHERVYDLFDFEYGEFDFVGGGLSIGTLLGVGTAQYVGVVTGWSNYSARDPGVHRYSGPSYSVAETLNLPFKVAGSTSGQGFITSDRNLHGTIWAYGLGKDVSPLPASLSFIDTVYTLKRRHAYHRPGDAHTLDNHPTHNDAVRFAAFITANAGAAGPWAAKIVLENGKLWERYSGP